MLAIVVSRAGESPWRKTFAANQVSIGSADDMMLKLAPDSADARHARIVVRDAKVIVVDLKSAGGTYVDRKRLTSPVVMKPGSELAIGEYTLRAFLVEEEPEAAPPERGQVERELLAAIAGGDDASRLVYADWLESIEDAPRAEFLRLQHTLDTMSPDAAGFERATDRLRELAAGLELGWRARVAKRTIEACPAFDFECPRQWAELALTDRSDVRHCGSCKQTVHYCASVEDAREHASRGHCVALDVTAARWDADLDAPFGVYMCDACGVDAGHLGHCPRCGSPTAQQLVRGRMAVRTPPW